MCCYDLHWRWKLSAKLERSARIRRELGCVDRAPCWELIKAYGIFAEGTNGFVRPLHLLCGLLPGTFCANGTRPALPFPLQPPRTQSLEPSHPKVSSPRPSRSHVLLQSSTSLARSHGPRELSACSVGATALCCVRASRSGGSTSYRRKWWMGDVCLRGGRYALGRRRWKRLRPTPRTGGSSRRRDLVRSSGG